MTADTESLMLEILKRIQSDVTELKFDMQEIKVRVTATEEHLGNIIMSMSGLNRRMDRFDERLTRVERRLDLRGAE